MAFKKIAVTNMKLKTGATVQGYLVGKSIKTINGDDGAFDLCNVILKTPTDVVSLWVQGNYAHVLKSGLMTRVSKVETNNDGEKGTRIDIEQDDTDTISAFDK